MPFVPKRTTAKEKPEAEAIATKPKRNWKYAEKTVRRVTKRFNKVIAECLSSPEYSLAQLKFAFLNKLFNIFVTEVLEENFSNKDIIFMCEGTIHRLNSKIVKETAENTKAANIAAAQGESFYQG